VELTETQYHADLEAAASAAVRAALADPTLNPPNPTDRPAVGGATRSAPPSFNVNLYRPVRPSITKAIIAARTGRWKGAELERDISEGTQALYGGSPGTRGAAQTDDDEDKSYPANGKFSMPTNAWALFDVAEKAAIRGLQSPLRDMAVAMYERSTGSGQSATRAMGEGTISAGLALVPPQYLQDQFVLALTTSVSVRNMPGVETIPVNSNVIYLPRESGTASASSAAEAATLTASDPTFAQQTFNIRKQYGYRQFDNELLSDANPALEAYITKTLARDVALFQDLQFLEGSGAGSNLQGINGYSGTTAGYTPSTNGDSWSATTAGTVIKLLNSIVYALRSANVEGNGWIMHPRTMQSLANLTDTNGRALLQSVGGNFGAPVVMPNAGTSFTYPNAIRGMLLGYPVVFTTQIPITETQGSSSAATHVFFGDWDFAKVLERQAMEIAVSEHILFTTDQTGVRAIARSALALTQPAAFVVQKGIIA